MARQTFKLHRFHGALLLALLLAGAAGWRIGVGHPPAANAAQPAADEPTGKVPDGLQWQGVSSCAAMACHHRNGELGSKQSEYTTWMSEKDLHSKAYQNLMNDRSKLMLKNLRNLKTSEEARPEQDALCLSCHTSDAKPERRGPTFNVSDGVGCESCHGPAENWVGVHRTPAWQQKTVAEKETFGMRATKNLPIRATICTECHVGTKDKEVNHDLIAAGHPRLYFDFATYLAKIPRHWPLAADKERNRDYEARAWIVGQLVCAEAALKLLAERAGDTRPSDTARPWPEFAEYDCFACHHDLKAKSWRQEHPSPDRDPGSLSWGTWYFSLLPQAAGDQGVGSAVGKVRKEMQKPSPARNTVKDLARRAADEVARVRTRRLKNQLSPADIRKLSDAIKKEEQQGGTSWDRAEQVSLGLTALYLARIDLDSTYTDKQSAQDKSILEAIVKQLRFPADYNSPRDFEPKPVRP